MVCLDFLFYANVRLVCNLDQIVKKNYFFHNNYQILWQSLIETYFFSLNLRENHSNQQQKEEKSNSTADQAKSVNLFEKISKKFIFMHHHYKTLHLNMFIRLMIDLKLRKNIKMCAIYIIF